MSTKSAPLSPDSYPPGYLAEYSGGRLIAVSICFLILGISFVALRFFAQRKTSSSFGWNDYLIPPALVANVGMCAHGIVMVKVAGVGHHLPAVLIQSPSKLVTWAKCIYALEWIYLAAVALPKLSILCLYLRIFVKKPYRMVTYVIIGMVISNWIAFILASTFQCSPVEYQWNKKISGHCFDVQTYYKFVNVPNILTDAVMLVLPMPMVWHLNIPRTHKLGLTVVFLAGSVGIVSSCIRLAVFCGTEALKDNTWASVSLVSWSVVEPGMYLIAACLPALRPICAQLVPKSFRSRFSSHSTRNTIVPLEDLPLAAHSAFSKPRVNDDSVLYHENIGFDAIGPAELETGETDEEKGMAQKYEEAVRAKNNARVSSTTYEGLER